MPGTFGLYLQNKHDEQSADVSVESWKRLGGQASRSDKVLLMIPPDTLRRVQKINRSTEH